MAQSRPLGEASRWPNNLNDTICDQSQPIESSFARAVRDVAHAHCQPQRNPHSPANPLTAGISGAQFNLSIRRRQTCCSRPIDRIRPRSSTSAASLVRPIPQAEPAKFDRHFAPRFGLPGQGALSLRSAQVSVRCKPCQNLPRDVRMSASAHRNLTSPFGPRSQSKVPR